jgi:hypothetical protein
MVLNGGNSIGGSVFLASIRSSPKNLSSTSTIVVFTGQSCGIS